jgi:hypothetical protein
VLCMLDGEILEIFTNYSSIFQVAGWDEKLFGYTEEIKGKMQWFSGFLITKGRPCDPFLFIAGVIIIIIIIIIIIKGKMQRFNGFFHIHVSTSYRVCATYEGFIKFSLVSMLYLGTFMLSEWFDSLEVMEPYYFFRKFVLKKHGRKWKMCLQK